MLSSVISVLLFFKLLTLTLTTRNTEMRMAFLSVPVLAAALFSLAANGQDAPKRSAELQVLNRFVGTWDFDVTNTPDSGEIITGKTSETRRWTLGGKFVQFENSKTEKPDEPEFQMLVTYDPATKTYPGVLMSGPNRAVVTGTWDPLTQTMTFRGTFSDNSGVKFEYTSRFLDDDYCESSGVISSATGEVIVKQLQKQTRRKK